MILTAKCHRKEDLDHERLGLVIHVVFARARLGRNDLGIRAAAQRSAEAPKEGD
jgi:hypothetical protein